MALPQRVLQFSAPDLGALGETTEGLMDQSSGTMQQAMQSFKKMANDRSMAEAQAEQEKYLLEQQRTQQAYGDIGSFGESGRPEHSYGSKGNTDGFGKGGTNANSLTQGLMKRGLPQHIAEGFVMNFQDESGLNPGINEHNPTVPGSRGGFGLYQLTGPRRVEYENFARQRGVNFDNQDAQLDFLMNELQGSESSAMKHIMATQDRGQAAAAIVNKFLRPAEQHRQSRVARYTSNSGYGSTLGKYNS